MKKLLISLVLCLWTVSVYSAEFRNFRDPKAVKKAGDTMSGTLSVGENIITQSSITAENIAICTITFCADGSKYVTSRAGEGADSLIIVYSTDAVMGFANKNESSGVNATSVFSAINNLNSRANFGITSSNYDPPNIGVITTDNTTGLIIVSSPIILMDIDEVEIARADSKGLTVSSNMYITGFSSANAFYGGGSNLTNVLLLDGTKPMSGQLNMGNQSIIRISTMQIVGGNTAGDFSVGGSTFVVRYGKIGIGTETPSMLLSVYSDTLAEGIRYSRQANSTGYGINIGGSNYASGIFFNGVVVGSFDSNGGLALGTYAPATTPRANGIIVSGDVGIGTSLPTHKLDVNGNMRVRSSSFTATCDIYASSNVYVTGFTQLGQKTGAELIALSPSAVGQMFWNTTSSKIFVSTGTGQGAWVASDDYTQPPTP